MVPLLIAAHLALRHDMLDMATHYDTNWDLATELRIDAAGAATFHLAGNVTSKGVELTPSTGARVVMPEHVTRIDDTWSGRATASGASIVIHFDRGAGFTAIDVEWRCDPTSLPVSGAATPMWKCATSQSSTRPTGPAHSLPVYMQLPTYLAPSPVALKVNQVARGGADHRSNETMLTLSR